MLTAEELQTYIDAIDVADTTRNDDILRIALSKFAVDRLSYGQRVAYWRPRAAHLIMRLLSEEHDSLIHEYCWEILTASLKLTDVIRDDPSPQEEETMDWAVIHLGMTEAMARELRKPTPRQISVLLACLVPCTNICLCPKHVKRLIDSGVVHGLMNIVSDEANIPIGARLLALISLTNIAIHPESHPTLIQLGAITTAIGLLRFLTSTDMQMVDVGLSAAFLICRVAGRDESGPGMESIHSNVRLISKLWWILDAVLRAGPNGVVLGSHWNPANIVLDVSILAQSDRNKPLLKDFIPLLVTGLEACGSTNKRLVEYTVAALKELLHHEDSRRTIEKYKHRLIPVLEKKRPFHCDLTTYQNIAVLVEALLSSPTSLHSVFMEMLASARRRLVRASVDETEEDGQ